jgi:hypothetical protein
VSLCYHRICYKCLSKATKIVTHTRTLDLQSIVCEMSRSCGSEYEDERFLGKTPYSLVEVYRRFRGAYCLHHQGKILAGPTDSDISSWVSAHGLFIALMMEAVHTSETSVYFNETTRRYIPEGSYLKKYSSNYFQICEMLFVLFMSMDWDDVPEVRSSPWEWRGTVEWYWRGETE